MVVPISVPCLVREADVEWLIDEEQVSEDVPGGMELFGFTIFNSDGSNFGVGTELRAGTWSSLEPDEKRNTCR